VRLEICGGCWKVLDFNCHPPQTLLDHATTPTKLEVGVICLCVKRLREIKNCGKARGNGEQVNNEFKRASIVVAKFRRARLVF